MDFGSVGARVWRRTFTGRCVSRRGGERAGEGRGAQYRDPMGVSRMLPLRLHSRRTRRGSAGLWRSRLAWGGHLAVVEWVQGLTCLHWHCRSGREASPEKIANLNAQGRALGWDDGGGRLGEDCLEALYVSKVLE